MSPNSMPNGHVLVVEDDIAIRESLVEILAEEGYAAAGVANGKEALVSLRGRPLPRLIVLDLMMPVMDGWEFRRQQQQDPALASVPVVVVTADERALQQPPTVDADAYFLKPIDLDAFLAKVEEYCRP